MKFEDYEHTRYRCVHSYFRNDAKNQNILCCNLQDNRCTECPVNCKNWQPSELAEQYFNTQMDNKRLAGILSSIYSERQKKATRRMELEQELQKTPDLPPLIKEVVEKYLRAI